MIIIIIVIITIVIIIIIIIIPNDILSQSSDNGWLWLLRTVFF